MFNAVIKFIRLISSEAEPFQISMAFSLAMVAGFTPLLNLHNIIVILLLLVLRVNIASFLLALPIFSALAYLLDPLFHSIGHGVLTHPAMMSLFTDMYNNTFWRLTNFNNTIVMGSLLFSLVLFVPLLLLSNFLVRRYRSHVLVYFKNSKLFNFLQKNKLFTEMLSKAE